MQKSLSPKQVALSIGVSESSLKRWCDRGAIRTERTVGGHRRIPVSDVLRFLRDRQLPVVRPEILGLPAHAGRRQSSPTPTEQTVDSLVQALVADDRDAVRGLTINLMLAGASLVTIGDRVIAPAMDRIGQLWEHGAAAVYQERRACELVSETLYELRDAIAATAPSARARYGGTPSEDPYRLATQLVELTLREAGWNANSLGSGLPLSSLLQAAWDYRPELLWLSVSHLDQPQAFAEHLPEFVAQLPGETQLAVGGRAWDNLLRGRVPKKCYCPTLAQLVVRAEQLGSSPGSERKAAAEPRAPYGGPGTDGWSIASAPKPGREPADGDC